MWSVVDGIVSPLVDELLEEDNDDSGMDRGKGGQKEALENSAAVMDTESR